MKTRLLSILCILLASLGIQAQNAEFETATEAVKNMKIGWNLVNTLDSHSGGEDWGLTKPQDWETCWGNPVTKPELLKMIRKAGFNTMRIPVTWYPHTDAQGNIDPAWMKRVHEVVDYVIDQGMYCILNTHHDSSNKLTAEPDNYEENREWFENVWRQIANEFKDYDQHLLFEGYNEMTDKTGAFIWPSDSLGETHAQESYQTINDYAQSFVNTVRSTGGNNLMRNLIVNPYSACVGPEDWCRRPYMELKIPNDITNNHIIFGIHCYWMNVEEDARGIINNVNECFTSRGVPTIISEYGTGMDNLDITLTKQASENGIAPIIWNHDFCDGIFRSYPAFNDVDKVKAALKTYYGENYEPTMLTVADYDNKLNVIFKEYDAELGLFNVNNSPYSLDECIGLRVVLKDAPEKGILRLNAWGEDGVQTLEIQSKSATIMFDRSQIGEKLSLVTLQSKSQGSYVVEVDSIITILNGEPYTKESVGWNHHDCDVVYLRKQFLHTVGFDYLWAELNIFYDDIPLKLKNYKGIRLELAEMPKDVHVKAYGDGEQKEDYIGIADASSTILFNTDIFSNEINRITLQYAKDGQGEAKVIGAWLIRQDGTEEYSDLSPFHGCKITNVEKYEPESPVTIIANDLTIVYGDDVPELTYTTEGWELNGTPKLSTTATKTSPVGTYPIKVEQGTVTNTKVTYIDGTLTITQAPLTVGVQEVTITEGDAIPSFTLTYSGFRNGDTESNAFSKRPTATTTATSSSKPGTYPITISGGDAKNYALSYTQGTLTIKEKEQEPIADGTYSLTLDMFHEWDGCTATSKIVNRDCGGEIHVGETLNAGNLVYGGSSVFYTQYADLTEYNTLVIIGTPGMEFRVLLNRLEVGNGGGDDNGGSWTELNPVIGKDGKAVIDLSDYDYVHLNAIKTGWGSPEGVVESLSIVRGKTEQPVTIIANDLTMTYGDEVPKLTYTTEGEDLNGTPKLSTTATKNSPVGTYPIKVEQGTVTNEKVTYVEGTLTITQAPLTVGVRDVTITEGEDVPTFTLTYSGFRNNDYANRAFTRKPTATTTATSSSKPGTYPITVSGGEAKNYALTYTQGTLTIEPAVGIERVYVDGQGKVVIYNVNGQKLSKPRKGINIIGGKKIVNHGDRYLISNQ